MPESPYAASRILIIDDQPANVMLLEKLLRTDGYEEIRTLNDSRQAAAVYLQFRPDLVLLDLHMPHLDGFQVMEQLKLLEPLSYVPVLVLTADNTQPTRLRALQSGARDFLSKPLDMLEVRIRIRNMLEIRKLTQSLSEHTKLLEQKVVERTRDLEEAQLEILRRLAHAAEYRDDETGKHVTRMSRVAARLGMLAGMSPEDCEMLLRAAALHDVGKIGIPDRILLKPGPLSPEERVIMKTHVSIGADILGGSKFPITQMAQQIAELHHENWDGSGYPHGLKGEEIPLVSRICHLVDVFDALVSNRPYKRSWSVDDAVNEIRRMSGTHFDPQLVELFFEHLPEMLAIMRDSDHEPALSLRDIP